MDYYSTKDAIWSGNEDKKTTNQSQRWYSRVNKLLGHLALLIMQNQDLDTRLLLKCVRVGLCLFFFFNSNSSLWHLRILTISRGTFLFFSPNYSFLRCVSSSKTILIFFKHTKYTSATLFLSLFVWNLLPPIYLSKSKSSYPSPTITFSMKLFLTVKIHSISSSKETNAILAHNWYLIYKLYLIILNILSSQKWKSIPVLFQNKSSFPQWTNAIQGLILTAPITVLLPWQEIFNV